MTTNKKHLTIKETASLTGKHPDTIRAFMRKHKKLTTTDKKGRVLIPMDLITAHYDTTQPQTPPDATEQGIDPNVGNQSDNTQGAVIDALLRELDAKNILISQQQETIQKIVDQQQQLTAGLMTSTNQTKQLNDQVDTNTPKSKKRWWSKK